MNQTITRLQDKIGDRGNIMTQLLAAVKWSQVSYRNAKKN